MRPALGDLYVFYLSVQCFVTAVAIANQVSGEAFQELQRMIAASGLLVFVKDNRMVSIILIHM